jgi:hypothetical protein
MFPPEKAKALWDRFEFVYTPKHGSWLNMAEIELNIITGQWQEARNNKNAKVIGNSQPRMHG